MTAIGPVLALVGVVIGAGLSYLFAVLGERRRERWTLGREWRERRLQAYGSYIGDIKRMRDLAQRIAASVNLDDQAPALPRDAGLELLADANMARSTSFETVNLIGGKEVIESGRELNRAVWRMEWFARGFLDDSDREGWLDSIRKYHRAIDAFHRCARRDIGVGGDFLPRSTEPSPRAQYELDRLERGSASVK